MSRNGGIPKFQLLASTNGIEEFLLHWEKELGVLSGIPFQE
jgi:hypothetical protein